MSNKRISNDSISNIEMILEDLGVTIKNEEGDTYRDLADILDDLSKAWNKKIEQQEAKSKMDKLEELCRPISDYLKENYCPYDSVVITDDKIRLVRDEIGIPVERDSEVEDELDNLYNKLFKELSEDVLFRIRFEYYFMLKQNRI